MLMKFSTLTFSMLMCLTFSTLICLTFSTFWMLTFSMLMMFSMLMALSMLEGWDRRSKFECQRRKVSSTNLLKRRWHKSFRCCDRLCLQMKKVLNSFFQVQLKSVNLVTLSQRGADKANGIHNNNKQISQSS